MTRPKKKPKKFTAESLDAYLDIKDRCLCLISVHEQAQVAVKGSDEEVSDKLFKKYIQTVRDLSHDIERAEELAVPEASIGVLMATLLPKKVFTDLANLLE